MSKLAVVIPYHNPCRWITRKKNYHICRDRLDKQKADVFAVECGYLAEWEIEAEIKTHSSSIIWQKEALINYAMTIIPEEYDCIAWIDGDLMLDDANWVEKTLELLDTNDYVQLFQSNFHLTANNTELDKNATCRTQNSIIAAHNGFGKLTESSAPGGAWAAKRNKLKLGLCDFHIVGGGDSFHYNIIYQRHLGLGSPFWEFGSMRLRQCMLNWGEKHLITYPQLKITYLPCDMYHLFHGTTQDRSYCERHKILRTHDYDPEKDIKKVNGVWEWSSDKPEFHAEIRKYFKVRNEDLWS